MKGVVSHCHSCTSNEHRTSSTLCEVHKNLSSVMPGSLRDVFVSFFSGLLTSRSEDGFRSAPSHPRLANLTWRRGSVPQARMRVAWVSCGLPCGCGSSLGSKEIAMLYFFCMLAIHVQVRVFFGYWVCLYCWRRLHGDDLLWVSCQLHMQLT